MEPDKIIEIGQQALLVTLYLSGPPVLLALAVGLIVSLFQAATQLQEQTLTFVPKLVVIVAALIFLGNWMLGEMLAFSTGLLDLIPNIAG